MNMQFSRRRLLGASTLVPLAAVGASLAAAPAQAGPIPFLPDIPLPPLPDIPLPPPLAQVASVPVLPQFDPAPWIRQAALFTSKTSYTFTYEFPTLQGVPVAFLVPLDSFPTIEWLFTVVDSVVTTAIDIVGSLIPMFNGEMTGTLADGKLQLLAKRQQLEGLRTRFKELGNGKYHQLGDRPGDAYIDAPPEDMAQATIMQAELLDLFQQVQTVIGNLRLNLQELLAANQGIGDFGTKDGLARYNAIWQTASIPDVADNLHDDELFAYMRVGGFNTNVIERVTDALPDNFPVTAEQYREGIGVADDLSRAIAEGRVFLTNYAELGRMASEHATYKILTGDGYNSAPLALFALPPGGGRLQPVAIQCGQNPATAPMFVRPRPDDRDRFWGWQMAKTVVQTADFNHHEMLAHLGRGHLISEALTVATHRTLAPNHPLGMLLMPHFEGDIWVNLLAATVIIAPNTFGDLILAPQLGDIVSTIIEDRKTWDFYERMPHRDFARRGVDNAAVLKDFPYRDDSLLIWDAIEEWVGDYLRVYYQNDGDVQGDTELAAWCAEIATAGRITGFRPITSVDQLVEVATMIVYTTSAYHASVNFPQSGLMAYTPFVSGMTAAPAPVHTTGHTEADWIKMLPCMLTTLAQFFFLHQLGDIYYRPLGDYRTNTFPFPPVFGDPRITGPGGPLERFRANLRKAEDEIKRRNPNRFQPYEFLLPSNIPTSTNV
ncbi:lipoxygenase family protein [Nocardia altamirensis]|uniref:lipoxygenase family protein n=1 Tax=Nocardia altamirensis TaxID=472158 RepID=UPI00143553FF|nr:lipoxygenase family protein [Nocardia altamirensis]